MNKLFVLLLLTVSVNSYAQESKPLNDLLAKKMREQIDKENKFKKINDLLFLHGNFKEIIDNCRRAIDYPTGSALYSVVAYYMLGDTSTSNKILYNKIERGNEGINANARYTFSPIMIDFKGWLYYLSIPQNWKRIDSLTMSIYRRENTTEQYYGSSLMHLFMMDQYSRTIYDSYYHLMDSSKDQAKIPDSVSLMFRNKDSINRRKVYELFLRSGRLFKEKEVGSVFFMQFLLFAHEDDPIRRTYYLKLVKEAVSKKICSIDRLISFILRTKYLETDNLNEYKANLNSQIDSLKKEYNAPNYSFDFY